MELPLTLDPETSQSLRQQIYDQLRTAILTGRLKPEQRIPSTRELANSLGISRMTVVEGYDQLLSEGYLQTRRGAGTFVCSELPDDLLSISGVNPTETVASAKISLSQYGTELLKAQPLAARNPKQRISFRYGRPALTQFPLDIWRRLLTRHCRANPALLDYAKDAMGYWPLREAIAQYLSRARAVQCHADQIMIVSGSQQALDLITRVLIDPGDGVAIENPCYLGARRAFQSQGALLHPVAVDPAGLKVEELQHQLLGQPPSCKLVYVTPSHQFPTGATLSLPRRLALLAWAQQAGAMVIEDDYDSEYRYGDRPIPALQGLDHHQSVIYVGTFSKVMFPALRLGYVVIPPPLILPFSRAKWLIDRHAPLLEQYAMTEFIQTGHLERHIRRMRQRYDRNRQALVHALKHYLGDQVTLIGENAGIHLMAQIHTPLADSNILQQSDAVGVGLTSAAPYYLNESPQGQFIFGYAELNEKQIDIGIQRLGAIIQS